VPAVIAKAVREAGEPKPPAVDMAALRAEFERSSSRRELSMAAAVLWLSGLVWLGFANRYLWFGGVEMLVAVGLFVRVRLLGRS
jgi:hypothetical protein